MDYPFAIIRVEIGKRIDLAGFFAQKKFRIAPLLLSREFIDAAVVLIIEIYLFIVAGFIHLEAVILDSVNLDRTVEPHVVKNMAVLAGVKVLRVIFPHTPLTNHRDIGTVVGDSQQHGGHQKKESNDLFHNRYFLVCKII